MKSVRQSIRAYYYMTKPGIVYGNALTVIAGFFLASRGKIDLWLLLYIVVGTSLVIASACVVNNYIDRGIDTKMARTKKRALVTGAISTKRAILSAVIIGLVGFAILLVHTNILTFVIGIIAYIFYVVIYGFAKRQSEHGTLVGSISGALPPVAGYTAVTGRIDLGVVLLFLIVVAWQMPHFYAIAIYRCKDYARAGIPVLPVARSVRASKIQMLIYIAIFVCACVSLTLTGYTGISYAVVMVAISTLWFAKAVQGFSVDNNQSEDWARKLFMFSLIVTLVLTGMLVINSWLP